jgi:hypothetical protein
MKKQQPTNPISLQGKVYSAPLPFSFFLPLFKNKKGDLDVTPASAATVLGSAASSHPLALVHHGFLSLYTSSNADSKFNKTSARDQVIY